jgi:hypothetical protein
MLVQPRDARQVFPRPSRQVALLAETKAAVHVWRLPLEALTDSILSF